ncbi:hypothetical protein QTP88_003604 [Uroleucon formosanum]
MVRKKLSGYRLKTKEKARQIADVVKTKNIEHFFSVSTSNSEASVTTDSTKNVSNVTEDQVTQSITVDGVDVVNNVITMHNPTVLENSNNSNDGENILLEANNDNILMNVDQFKVPRDYLAYSQSTGAIFCIPCKLFGSNSAFVTTGFSNWKRADGHPKERFLCFLENTGHKSEKLTDDVLTTLALFNIDLANMRGQSYDNAAIFLVPTQAYKQESNRSTFLNYENSAKKLSGLSIYEENEKRKIKRKLQHGENRSDEVTLVGRESFIIKTYYVIIDNLLCELQKRKSAYDKLAKKFSFFHNITQYSTKKICQSAKELCEVYPNNLNVNLASEVVQLQGHIKSIETTDNNPKTIQQLMLWIRSNNFLILYPYVEVALRIFLSLASTNCSAERSFSVLKIVKNYLRSTMSQERCSALALLTIENELTEETDFEEIIHSFSNL